MTLFHNSAYGIYVNYSSLKLAAIANAVVPKLRPSFVQVISTKNVDYQIGYIVDESNTAWIVRVALSEESSTSLEAEVQVSHIFTKSIREKLSFTVPNIEGHMLWKENRCVTVSKYSDGTTLDVDTFGANKILVNSISKVLSEIHNLDSQLLEQSGLAVYTSEDIRLRKLNELDQIAATNQVPTNILDRWDRALEDLSLWRFITKTVHGDLYEGNILTKKNQVTEINNWGNIHVGDPADDFMWLISMNQNDVIGTILNFYTEKSLSDPDRNLMVRAQFGAEFAVAKWMLQGLALQDQAIVTEASSMLNYLEKEISSGRQKSLSSAFPKVEENIIPISAAENYIPDPISSSKDNISETYDTGIVAVEDTIKVADTDVI